MKKNEQSLNGNLTLSKYVCVLLSKCQNTLAKEQTCRNRFLNTIIYSSLPIHTMCAHFFPYSLSCIILAIWLW